MPPPHAAGVPRPGLALASTPSGQRSAYPHRIPPATALALVAGSERLCAEVDDNTSLLSSDLVISGCDPV
jgi:hypothetical protein